MGHSFCSGPSLPNGLKTEFATPIRRTKLTPRSPGFTAERRLPADDFTDSRNLHAIKDLLEKDPSSLIHTDSKRRKKIVELFAKPGPLSSKQVKQMLLSRRSMSPHSSTQPLPPSLTKDVTPRTTKDGKNYLQIATSSSMYECGNPSVYQVNHRQTVSGGKPPLRSLDNIDPYYLGITEEYPHLIINDGESRQLRGAETGENTESSLPPKPSQISDTFFNEGSSAINNLPKIHDVSGLAERQTSPVSKARIYGPKSSHSPLRVTTRKAHNHLPPSEVQPPATLLFPARKSQLPKTPRNSFEATRKEVQVSPIPNQYSKPPSIQSVTNSVADDAQSEASVGVVSMAQSAEVVRAGYYNSGAHKYPRPGPAPTGALPSLPEGLDSKTNIVYLPSVDSNGGHSLQSSPTRTVTRSPGQRNRYRPLDDAVNEDAVRLLRAQTQSRPKHAPQLQSVGQSLKPSMEEPCGDALSLNGTPQGPEKCRDSWRVMRVQSRKALKLHDLDRLRFDEDKTGQPGGGDKAATAGAQSKETGSKAAKTRESSSSPALLPGYQPNISVSKAPNPERMQEKTASKSSSRISPILVLAEQEPIHRPTTILSEDSSNKGVSHKQSPTKVSKHLPSPYPPSLPSSDEDSTQRRTTNPAYPNGSDRCSAARSTKSGANRTSYPQPHPYPTELSDLEFRLSARISELEKKNAMLLNAFVAVVNTSAGLAGTQQASVSFSHDGSGSNGGYRSSGLSGGSGMRSSGTSGGRRTSGGELERVAEGHRNGSEDGNEERDHAQRGWG